MKKWRPLFSFSSIPDPKVSFARKPFRSFSDLNFSLPSQHRTSSTRFFRKLAHPRDPFSRSEPIRFHSPNRQPKLLRPFNPSCYRCRGNGHIARFCKLPMRCFSCGEIGHKRSRCAKKEKSSLESIRPQAPEIEREEDLMFQSFQRIDLRDKIDIMMMDPDVSEFLSSFPPPGLRCNLSGIEQIEAKVRAVEVSCDEEIEDIVVNGLSGGNLANVVSGTDEEYKLDSMDVLNEYEEDSSPDPCFAKLEGLDCNSDEEEANDSPTANNASVTVDVLQDKGKEKDKGCIQSVDEVMCEARARALGSDKWSPPKPASSSKKMKTSKPFRGLIPAGCVRRSPRLNKGLV